MKVPTYVDGSGLTMYYTPNLRQYDSASITIGQSDLAIPPGADVHYHTAYCTSKCTKDFEEPIYLYSSVIHMHYLGKYRIRKENHVQNAK